MKAFGIINFEGPNVKVAGLGDYRPVPAFSFLGRYRLIDFMISNMTNSQIEHLQVYMNGEIRSLLEHLGTGRHYNINSKTGRLQLLTKRPGDQGLYNHDINAFHYNLEAIEEVNAEYVVIAPSFIIYQMDFREVIATHEKSQADLTIIYKPVTDADKHYYKCDCLTINENDRVIAMESNDGSLLQRNISLETYVLRKQLFLELIIKASNISSVFWLKDIIADQLEYLNVSAYRYQSDCYFICSLEDYYSANMTVKNYPIAKELFDKDWPVYTRTSDAAPVYYGEKAIVKNSVIANGSIIQGKVENCILGRQVIIEKGAEVSNSVILPGSYIGEDVKISYAVVDKKARICNLKKMNGSLENILYIKRKDII